MPQQPAPEQPALRVRIDASVVDRISADAMRGFGVTRRRGTESGGVLIGKIDARSRTVHVQEYEPVPCEYSQGPSYILSEADQNEFESALYLSFSTDSTKYPVGFFRSHTRDGLRLHEADQQLFADYFKQPLNIVLLVKPYATRPGAATVFACGEGNGALPIGVDGEEQPFTRGQELVLRPSGQIAADSGTPMSAAPEVATSKPAAPKTAATVEATPTPLPITTLTEAKETLGHLDGLPAAKTVDEEPPLLSPDRTLGGVWNRAASTVRSRSPLAMILIGFAATGVGLVVGSRINLLNNEKVVVASKAPSQPLSSQFEPLETGDSADPYAVSLSVKQDENNLLVQWNPEAPAVKKTLSATLIITERRSAPREVRLGFDELRNGKLVYANLKPDVLFRLQLLLADNRYLVEETAFGRTK
jgi:hypothetical protein